MVCIRGAVTCDINKKDEILSKTKEMLLEIIDRNSLKTDDIVSVIFTATRDIDKAYPAVAARELGITKAALMCFPPPAPEQPAPSVLPWHSCNMAMIHAMANHSHKIHPRSSG